MNLNPGLFVFVNIYLFDLFKNNYMVAQFTLRDFLRKQWCVFHWFQYNLSSQWCLTQFPYGQAASIKQVQGKSVGRVWDVVEDSYWVSWGPDLGKQKQGDIIIRRQNLKAY